MIEGLEQEQRVVGFRPPYCFEIGDMAAELAEQHLDPDASYTADEVIEIIRKAGNAAAVAFFESIGCGEIDLQTATPGETVRFTANADRSAVSEGSRWSWLRHEN